MEFISQLSDHLSLNVKTAAIGWSLVNVYPFASWDSRPFVCILVCRLLAADRSCDCAVSRDRIYLVISKLLPEKHGTFVHSRFAPQ